MPCLLATTIPVHIGESVKIHIHSTTQLVQVNGVPARVWEGHTDRGILVTALVTQLAIARAEDQAEFEADLREHVPPSAMAGPWPDRLILGEELTTTDIDQQAVVLPWPPWTPMMSFAAGVAEGIAQAVEDLRDRTHQDLSLDTPEYSAAYWARRQAFDEAAAVARRAAPQVKYPASAAENLDVPPSGGYVLDPAVSWGGHETPDGSRP